MVLPPHLPAPPQPCLGQPPVGTHPISSRQLAPTACQACMRDWRRNPSSAGLRDPSSPPAGSGFSQRGSRWEFKVLDLRVMLVNGQAQKRKPPFPENLEPFKAPPDPSFLVLLPPPELPLNHCICGSHAQNSIPPLPSCPSQHHLKFTLNGALQKDKANCSFQPHWSQVNTH